MRRKKKRKERFPIRISLKVEKELAEKLMEAAEEEDRSLNNMIRRLLWKVLREGE
jgi:hypothetical protein